MHRSFLILLLIMTVTQVIPICGLDGVSQKSSSKVSDFKAKLAKTELNGKAAEAAPLKSEGLDNVSISELGISAPPEYANDTVKQDHHTYYNSTFYSDPEAAKQFWVDVDSMYAVTHEKLSDSYRQATTVELSFDFPFYGSLLRNVTIATGGFLYMGDYLHNWIAATQYIAPLMANFDTSLSTESVIKYADNGTAFTVQWEKVYIQRRMNEGAFTFQTSLLKNGDIIFAYKDIPYPISTISDSLHPVKIGISDAYILERAIFFVRRKTVYEYHRIQIKWNISNNTALYFVALPTCAGYKDCSSCLAADTKLECGWCEAVKRCSDGIDRQRQSWVMNGCTINKEITCSAEGTVSTYTETSSSSTSSSKSISAITKPASNFSASNTASSATYRYDTSDSTSEVLAQKSEESAHLMQPQEKGTEYSISPGAIATIVVFFIILISVAAWIVYAYRFPQTSSGQFLIKYRPSQWTLRKEDTTITSNSRHL